MIRTLGFLVATEARNRLRRQAARVRNPRYAVALLVGLAYFGMIFGGPDALRGGTPPDTGLVAGIRRLGPLVLAVYAAATWIFGRSDAVAMRPAEVSFLLTGPLTRRDLLRYRLLNAQVPLLFSTTFMTLISHTTTLPWYLRFPSFWVLLAILHLHHTAAALVHASAEQEGIVGWRRNWLPIALFGSAALVLGLAVSGALAEAGRAGQPLMPALQRAVEQPVPAALLLPFRLALAPLLAAPRSWVAAFGLALLVLLAHYAWVLRSNVAFEEAAAEAGERRARASHALRSGGGWRAYKRALQRARGETSVAAAPYPLRLAGAPAGAVLWKNLTFARRNTSLASPVVLGLFAMVFVSLSGVSGSSVPEAVHQVGVAALMFGGLLVVFGPVMIRNDLRMDLRQVELLRTLPLPPAALAGAEIAASAITVSVFQLALILLGAVLVAAAGQWPVPPGYLLLGALGAVLLLPALATLGVTIQCAIALTFPAWVHLGRERSAGVEAMGQNILTMVGSLLLLALLLIVPALLAAAGTAALWGQWGVVAPALGGLLGIAAVYGEVWLSARALGRLFERTDPSDIGLTH